MPIKIAFTASRGQAAQAARKLLSARYGTVPEAEADVIVALGGDGFMLATLHRTQALSAPVYGMNRGTIGFLMNAFSEDDLVERLSGAEEEVINPLLMRATRADGKVQEALAINEVSLLRAGPQAAKLRISVDGRVRMEELVCDGALVATPAGSTAYNYSAHGPILPIGSDVLALTAIAPSAPAAGAAPCCRRRRRSASTSWSRKNARSWRMRTAAVPSPTCCRWRSDLNRGWSIAFSSIPATGWKNG